MTYCHMAYCHSHQMTPHARLTVTCVFAMEAAVASGEKAAIPIPAAVWLSGSGLLGLIGIVRRKKVA